jgi:DNA-binding response OmpR family regulator
MKGPQDMSLYIRARSVTPVCISPLRISGPAATAPVFLGLGRILLVDDEIDLWWADCLAEFVRSGCRVDTAENGELGWEALQRCDYDLLITDNKMPKVYGLELIIHVRDQGMTVPIIFASSLLPRITPEQRPYFVNVHLLEKPVTPSQLLKTLHQIPLTHARSHDLSSSVSL